MKVTFKTITLLIITLAGIAGGLLLYFISIDNVLTEQNDHELHEIMQQQIFNFDLKLHNDKMMLINFASFISDTGVPPENIVPVIRKLAETSDFEFIDYIMPDGSAVTIDGRKMQLDDREYFKRAIKGEVVVSEPFVSRIRNITIVLIAAPIYKDGNIVGVLTGSYDSNMLSKLFLPAFEGTSYAYVITKTGEIIAKNSNEYTLTIRNNLLDDFKDADFRNGYTLEDIKQNIYNGSSGHISYSLRGENRRASYGALDDNGWTLFAMVPDEFLAKSSNTILSYSAFLIVCIMSCALIFTVFYVMTSNNAKNKAMLNEKCFKALSEQSGKVVLEWDCNAKKLTQIAGNTVQGISVQDLVSNTIHEDDDVTYKKIFDNLSNGISFDGIRYRAQMPNGEFNWIEISMAIIKDEKGKPFKGIGTIQNIQELIQREEYLRQKAERDQLTGLYNKKTTELLIKRILADRRYISGNHALIIIDVDNFKSINDKLGHLYGDLVLSSLSEKLKPIFRADDVIGRVGGDEFFVFLKGFNDISLVKAKAKEIGDLFRNTYTEGDVIVNISSSIGIAISPEHGTDFDSLYKNADIALYNTKAKGKNNYTVYDGQTSYSYQSSRTDALAL